jgi:LuxR family maltose regulon positive regulatory protein
MHAPEALQDAERLLKRLLRAAEAGNRMGSYIEILIVQALAQAAQGKLAGALAPLGQALSLAEPQGYIRSFADEGAVMKDLLQAAADRGIAPLYVRRLLAAFDGAEYAPSIAEPLIEPLSDRELEVLRLLGTELSGPEIARELIVSLNTLRTHTKNIYGKLGVSNRRAALRRAAELGLR